MIELLVVIAIISLLVSILLPSLQRARDLAAETICSGRLRHTHFCFNMYAEDYDRWLPIGDVYCGAEGKVVKGVTPFYWWNMIRSYTGADELAPEILKCPNHPLLDRMKSGVWNADWSTYSYNPHSISMNGAGHTHRTTLDSPWREPDRGFHDDASSAVLLGEDRMYYTSGTDTVAPHAWLWLWAPSRMSQHHLGESNTVYFDGHVGSVDCSAPDFAAKWYHQRGS